TDRLGTWRHLHDQVFSVGAVPERTFAVTAAGRAAVRPALQLVLVAQRVVAEQDHVAAAAAVAAVGTALRHMRFTSEADAAVAAGARLHLYLLAVVEHGAPA